MKRILLTGAGSFTARHLAPLLAGGGDSAVVLGTDAAPGVGGVAGLADYRALDLADPTAARTLVEWARPDRVFHLAGVSGPDAEACYAVNLGGTRRLLEACADLAPGAVVLVVSSAAVYGLTTPEENPVRESTPMRPLTAYGASKAAAELFALALHRRGVLRVVVARPFNLIGPGLRAGMAPADFMAQALAIRDGRAAPEVRVGSLEPRRDFVDVRDAARAYQAMVETEACLGAAWNVASGRPVAIRDLLSLILEAAGVTARIVEEASRRRAVEALEQVGDASALGRATGWSPRIALEESVRQMAAEPCGETR